MGAGITRSPRISSGRSRVKIPIWRWVPPLFFAAPSTATAIEAATLPRHAPRRPPGPCHSVLNDTQIPSQVGHRPVRGNYPQPPQLAKSDFPEAFKPPSPPFRFDFDSSFDFDPNAKSTLPPILLPASPPVVAPAACSHPCLVRSPSCIEQAPVACVWLVCWLSYLWCP